MARRACSLRGLPRGPVTAPLYRTPRLVITSKSYETQSLEKSKDTAMPQNSPGTPAPHTVIIGGTAGIGLATARQLLAEGHAVTVVGRDADRVKRALDPLAAQAPRPEAVGGRAADLASRAELDALFGALGPVDHLVVTSPGDGS